VASGIPYGQGLVKNRYIGRTFIAPTQAERANGVRRKLNPLKENIAGKRVIVVDDSIVRGTTTRAMVAMLREAGATEVHLRISSPPFRWPCYYGIDTPAAPSCWRRSRPSARSSTSSVSTRLEYLTLERWCGPSMPPVPGFCDACLTGNYPVPVSVVVDLSPGRR
jgi:amidophosphoribosyltransferase